MALFQFTCIILATTLVKISEAQRNGRNGHCNGVYGGGVTQAYLPVVLTDQIPSQRDISTRNPTNPTTTPGSTPVTGQSSKHTELTNDDLNALLLLARVLENDKSTCATKGIDVDRLLETLVTALVYTTTHTVETSMNRCNTPAQNDANNSGLLGHNGLVDKLLSTILGGQSGNADCGGRQATTGSVAQGSHNGKSLVGLDLGQDGLGLNVGDLADVNVGGKRPVHHSLSGKSSTTTATSSATNTAYNEEIQANNKELLGGVASNDDGLSGVLKSVGGVVDGVVGTLDGVGETHND